MERIIFFKKYLSKIDHYHLSLVTKEGNRALGGVAGTAWTGADSPQIRARLN